MKIAPYRHRALVVGGGFSGMTAAMLLAKAGMTVELVEIDPAWKSYGAGIAVSGATLRAFKAVGILDQFLDNACVFDGIDMFAPNDRFIERILPTRAAGSGLPGCGAVMRPTLAKILADATIDLGVTVQIGWTFKAISQDAAGVAVDFTDGSQRRYDLVIGADGLHSRMRQMLFPSAPAPVYSGRSAWRAVLPRPKDLERPALWVGADTQAGLHPVSRDLMYLFVTEKREGNTPIDPAGYLIHLKSLLAAYPSARLVQMSTQLNASSKIVFRPVESFLMPGPWYQGRVVLIGDAVHATTPHLASGVGIGMEDAIVLAEELARDIPVSEALRNFQERRWGRCRMVYENSERLARLEMDNGDTAEHIKIFSDSMAALAEPI